MFEQVDGAFQNGMSEHGAAIRQQVAAAHTPLAQTLSVDAPLDPVKEISRLISERKFDEAFTMALQRGDVSIVSWLCSQVDLHELCRMIPIPLNQGVLLALFQQLACDIVNGTPRKLEWMTAVAVAISPTSV
ncbi:hypothetical protein GUJ93_ZPchr0012g20075 [Zizania palustris]|uniref:Enhancer of mRNA-decapping protein 4 C-terminal domain-containing protein n=1 Tax=Zizania palustris TaxID=103762 RepID=A0A8J6BV66_ZIZPA|nr:hypothetical protein GUJ93_ZPchr0012g20075 [Zizania palustris]